MKKIIFGLLLLLPLIASSNGIDHMEDWDFSVFTERDLADRLKRPDQDIAIHSLYKQTSADSFVQNQTTQGMILSVMLLFNKEASNRAFMIDSVLKENIKTLNITIKELADSCTLEKNETHGQFKENSTVVKNMKGIDLVNRELHRKGLKFGKHRKSDPTKVRWFNNIHAITYYKYKYIYPRSSKDINGISSFNICKYSDTYQYYDDIKPEQLCKSVSELSSCLVALHSSGKAPNNGLNLAEMSQLFYDFMSIDDIEDLMSR